VPLIGLAAYSMSKFASLGKHWFQNLLWNLKSSRERVALLDSQLAESTTVRNRLALSEELHAAGQYDRECQVIEEGLRGAFKDDATLLMRLAESHLQADRVSEAASFIAKTVPEKSPESQLHYALLKARLASRQNEPQAERLFQELVNKRRSEGPRYYYAEHLLTQGRRDEALRILNDVLFQYRHGTVVWRFQEQKWYRAAKKLLRSPVTRGTSNN
jgi:hypothetical protein